MRIQVPAGSGYLVETGKWNMWMALKLKNPRGSSNDWKVSLLAIDLLKIIDNRLDSFLGPEK